MNLNEVKKQVYFNLILYILIGVCLLLSIFAILIIPVKAVEQTSDITNDIHLDSTVCSSSGGSGTYCADYGYTRHVKTTYNGRAQCIAFAFDYYFLSSRDYTVNIIANSNDFRNNNLQYYGYSYTTYPANASSVNVQGRFINRQKIQIVFPYDAQQTHAVQICSNGYMTGDTNYNIKQVYLTYDDGQQDLTGIIDNQTQNTTDIINNNNSNSEITHNLISNFNDNMKELFQSCYKNYLTQNMIKNLENMRQEGNTFTQISSDSRVPPVLVLTAYNNFTYINQLGGFTLYNTGNYSFYFTKQDNFNKLFLKFNGAQIDTGFYIDISSLTNGVTYYLSFNVPNITQGTLSFQNLLLTDKPSKPFIDFGTLYCTGNKFDSIEGAINGVQGGIADTNQKLDDITDIQQDQYDYLTDDSDPNVNSNGINNVIGNVQVQDPLNYLLTLPLNLLTKLNTLISSGTCNRASFGELYGTEIYLPCINFENYLGSSLWSTIDTIVGIGLLVVILKKFYDTISNILSLGKEEEIRKGMELPTPMEFLAQILGGGR